MLDAIDHKILLALQTNCRQTLNDIAGRAGLSASACHRRVALLEKMGVIEGYGARINPEALGLALSFYVEVSLKSQSEAVLAEFEFAAMAHREVLECHLMTGQADYLIKIATASTPDYEKLYRSVISSLPHVARIQSSLVMKTIKTWKGCMG